MVKQLLVEKKRLWAFVVAFAMVTSTVFSGALPSASAMIVNYYLTDGAVELNGSDNGEVTVNFNSADADAIYSIEGNFAPSVAVDGHTYFTLTSLNPGGGLSASSVGVLSNTVEDGRIYYQEWTNGFEVVQRGALWSATYAVDKDTPAGDYKVALSSARVASESAEYDTVNLGTLEATVTVTRSEPAPAGKPSQVMTFRDSEGNVIGTEGITKSYGDADFTVTKEVTTGDGAISEYHPDDDGSGSVAHTVQDSDLVGVGMPGEVEICAWVAETETYAATRACYTVHVAKKLVTVTSATFKDKVYDGTPNAEFESLELSDNSLLSGWPHSAVYAQLISFNGVDAGYYENEVVAHLVLDDSLWNTHTFSREGDGRGTGVVGSARILPFTLTGDNATVALAQTEYDYSGEENKPAVTVTVDLDGDGTKETALVSGADYEVSYSNNVNAGTAAAATVTGKGNYTGTMPAANFTIKKVSSGEPAEMTAGLTTAVGNTLAQIGGLSAGFAWANPDTVVLAGTHVYEATYIRNNDANNYVSSAVSVPVYGLKEDVAHPLIKVEGQTHVRGVDAEAQFEIDADYALFENGGAVLVDGEVLDERNYRSWSASTVIELSAEYLDSLELGEHTLAVLFGDGGVARTTFNIVAPAVPEEPAAADTGVFTGVAGGAVATGCAVLGVVVLAGALYVVVSRKGKES